MAHHLRMRGEGVEQPITTVELFFDLVYVFAVTQLPHMILGDLTAAEVGRAAFLLLIVWWAWIYTTWMAKWFQRASPAVRAVLTGVMLASLLMAAALPDAFDDDGVLFAAKRLAVAAIVVLLAPLGPHLGALALCATVATLLSALALWELRTPARDGLLGQLRNIQLQPEGTS